MALSMLSKPYFYKILIDLAAGKLALPEAFTDKYSRILPHKAKLKIASGATWDVGVEKSEEEEGVYFFTKGWTRFSQDMELQLSEILIFSYVGNSIFNVTVYSSSAFEKESNFRVVRNPQYQVVMKHHLRLQLRLPSSFVEGTGLHRERKVWLEYGAGGLREEVRLNKNTLGVVLGAGWSRFYDANGLSPGTTYSFEFILSTKVIRVEPV